MPEDIQDEHVDQIRSADGVVRRCLVLHAVLAVVHKVPGEQVVSWLRRESLWDAVSPEGGCKLIRVNGQTRG
jgi:hypothetical protein